MTTVAASIIRSDTVSVLPAVRFGPGEQFELVDIASRPVIARYYGLGQINASTQL